MGTVADNDGGGGGLEIEDIVGCRDIDHGAIGLGDDQSGESEVGIHYGNLADIALETNIRDVDRGGALGGWGSNDVSRVEGELGSVTSLRLSKVDSDLDGLSGWDFDFASRERNRSEVSLNDGTRVGEDIALGVRF